MPRPGVDVQQTSRPAPRGPLNNTATLFIVGKTTSGRVDIAVPVHGIAEFEQNFGVRRSDSGLWDFLDEHFREGGALAYVGRVVGPAATVATLTIGLTTGVQINASGPGPAGSLYSVGVVAGTIAGTIAYQITGPNSYIEQSPDFAATGSNADAANWSQQSPTIRIIALGTVTPPVTAAAPLVGGTEDTSNITEVQYGDMLPLFLRDYGPGQVEFADLTTSAAHALLVAHVGPYNRCTVLQAPSGSTQSAVQTLVASAQTSAGVDSWRVAMAPQWAVIPGLAPLQTRLVPYSAVLTGQIARTDAAFNVGTPPAGPDRGSSVYAIALDVNYNDVTIAALNTSGVITAKIASGGVATWGYRSIANPSTYPQYREFSGNRATMAIQSDLEAVALTHLFRVIDGRGHEITDFALDIQSVLLDYWNDDVLFGDTAADAFSVSAGPTINTPTTIANGELHAIVMLHTSPFAEWVQLNIVKVKSQEAVS